MDDITGQTFNRWTAVEKAARVDTSKPVYWKCVCSCGVEREVKQYNLVHNKSKSCGCLQREIAKQTLYLHGLYNTRINTIWAGMMSRCNNPKEPAYANYGGRGISVCERWHTFTNFYEDMIETYSDNLSIERIDVNGNYEPSNCKWVTMKEQSYNKRTTVLVTYNGVTECLALVAQRYGVKLTTLYDRIVKMGWDVEKAVTTPPHGSKRVSRYTSYKYRFGLTKV